MDRYKETMIKWADCANMYNINAQINLIFRILFNILWVLVFKEILTQEQADSLVMELK